MSNINSEGRRYSRRVAGEEITQIEDPFTNNDLSDILSNTNAEASPSIQANSPTRRNNSHLTDDDLSLNTEDEIRDFLDNNTLGVHPPRAPVNSSSTSHSSSSARTSIHSERLAYLEKNHGFS